MSIIVFEDDEYYKVIEGMSLLQILFFNRYSVNGKYDIDTVDILRKLDTPIILDNNISSPICECIRTGTLKDEYTLRKIALLITFSKMIGAQLSCGFSILEGGSSKRSIFPAKELRQQFLYAVDKIPTMIWKQIAFGYLDEIPQPFLVGYNLSEDYKNYEAKEDLDFLAVKASIFKIVNLVRDKTLSNFEKFVSFFTWTLDNLLIIESVVMYAALVFGEIEDVKKPKHIYATDINLIEKGIDNQTWDLYYIVIWSSFYYNSANNEEYGFATDDSTLKRVIVNILPKETMTNNLLCIFKSKTQHSILQKIYETKMGSNRKKAFEVNERDKGMEIAKRLISYERNVLMESLKD